MPTQISYPSPYSGEYRLNKSSWLPGPWQDEVDELYFTHQGLPCAIIRAQSGHLCGYVGVEKEHPSANNTGAALSVHGGVTWERPSDDNDLFWIGFDCAHSGDLVPKHMGHALPGTYRDIAYVLKEVIGLAKQLAQVATPVFAISPAGLAKLKEYFHDDPKNFVLFCKTYITPQP